MRVQSDNAPAEIDDFRGTGVHRTGAAIVDLFGRFFGCEADDAP